MRGFVPTPEPVVDRMVDRLFRGWRPTAKSLILDPGCGEGAFVDGVLRWCAKHRVPVPQVIGVELDPSHVAYCRKRFRGNSQVRIVHADFLDVATQSVDAVIGNPPYVSIERLSEVEKSAYRARFATATGRFDLYSLFFERSLRWLRPGGRLVFITPEKFTYVESTRSLRSILAAFDVEELQFVDEATFAGLVTYPVITTVRNAPAKGATRVTSRAGETRLVRLKGRSESWLPLLQGHKGGASPRTLRDICVRISCGVATGADRVYVRRASDVPKGAEAFAYPTVSGRDLPLEGMPVPRSRILVPYSLDGGLLPERQLGGLGQYLDAEPNRTRLLARTCAKRKPWWAFHETPPMEFLLKPKILCKDIGPRPAFVADVSGGIVPRHSVYYIVPRDSGDLEALLVYLNSQAAVDWLMAHCQRAANGFIRLQSSVLKRLPIPQALGRPAVESAQARSA